jgi:NAD(P)-dependent dehydrogenase (short-subunit alcohol dehydrogenase family)
MTTLVVGASGATGRLLVKQLLDRGENVRAVVRSPDRFIETVGNHENLSVIRAGILELSDVQMAGHVDGCDALASCLGHTLSLKGMFGAPRRLVTDAVRRLCDAIKACDRKTPVRFVLMNTAGNGNRDLHEPVSFGERCIVGLFRQLLPPHADNEDAADYLRTQIGRDDETIQWCAVRPDSLIDEDEVTEYALHASPIRSAIFNPGKTSRINVAHFMSELATGGDAWRAWQGKMPVIYNVASNSGAR